ncbi:MAG: cyclase [Chloroflexi bacterium]|nr:cyclase [Chloroflexota bacterium]
MQRVERSVRVAVSPNQAYELWSDFEHFPNFMEHVLDVRKLNGRESHWKIRGPMGTQVEFDAETCEDEPSRSIGWRSIDGRSQIGTSGNVTFSEVGGQTLVHVILQWFDAPGGFVGEAVAHLAQNVDQMLDVDLRRFKRMAEGQLPEAI